MKTIVKLGVMYLFLVISTEQGKAQQQGLYSQYMLNYYLVNPAAAGTEDFLDLRAGYRNQWTGLEGAPRNYYFTGHAPIAKLHDKHDKKFHGKMENPYHVVGGIINGQALGAMNVYNLYGTYAYNLPLSLKWKMVMGASAGGIYYGLDQSKVQFATDQPDQSIQGFNKFRPDLGIGFWLFSDKLFGGLSTMQLFDLSVGDNGRLNRHFYATGGTKISLDRYYKLIPSIMLRSNPSGTAYQVDLNCKLKFTDLVWSGISYRHQDAVVLLAGVKIKKQFEVGYSYDATTSRLRNYSFGSHEIMIAYLFEGKPYVISPSDFW